MRRNNRLTRKELKSINKRTRKIVEASSVAIVFLLLLTLISSLFTILLGGELFDTNNKGFFVKRLSAVKKPIPVAMLQVTKKELLDMKKKYPFISIGDYDKKWMSDISDDIPVGVIAGDIDDLDGQGANGIHDVWFINKDFFDSHYDIVTK